MDFKTNRPFNYKQVKKIKDEFSTSKDWWDKLEQAEKASINRGLEDFKQGNTHTKDKARKVYEKHL